MREKRRNENMPTWTEGGLGERGGKGEGEPADNIKSQFDEFRSQFLALVFLTCPPSILVSTHFFNIRIPAFPPTHAEKTSLGWRGWSRRWRSGCLATPLMGLCCMHHCSTNLHWSTVTGHTFSQMGHFQSVCVCACVCAYKLNETLNEVSPLLHNIHLFFPHFFSQDRL